MSIGKDYVIIDKYVVDYTNILGKGAMAKVYAGYFNPERQTSLNDQARFAIKEISTHSSFAITDSLLQQINLLRKINHPFILKYVDAKKSPKSLFLILQFCNGGTLQDFILANKGQVSQQMLKRIIAQCVIALKFLKEQKIIHRDIKPKNILLHQGNIKIADFGVAKIINEHNEDKETITFSGTIQFMSPQILRQNKYTYQTDVWSLGVTFFFMIFGKLPYTGSNIFQILKQIEQEGGIQIPDEGNPQLRDIIQRMLVYEQCDRITIEQLISHPYLASEIQSIQNQFLKECTIEVQHKQISKAQFFVRNQTTVSNPLLLRKSKQITSSIRASQFKQELALQAYGKLNHYKDHILFFQQVLNTLRMYNKKKDIIEYQLFLKCQFLLVKRCYIIAKDLYQMLLFGTHTQGNIYIQKQIFQALIDDKNGKNSYNKTTRDAIGRLYEKFKNDWLNTKEFFYNYQRTQGIKIINRADAYQQSLVESPHLIEAFNDCFFQLFLQLSKGIIETYGHRLNEEITNSNIVLNFGVNITFIYDIMIVLCFPNISENGNMNSYKDRKKHIPCQQFIYRISLAYDKWTKQAARKSES